MKKLFTNLKVAMTLLLLCGVCSAWAETVSLDAQSGFPSSYSNKDFTVTFGFHSEGVMYNGKGTPTGFAGQQLIQLRKSGSTAGIIYNTDAINTISSIKIYLQADNDFTVYYGNTKNPSANTLTKPSSTNEDVTCATGTFKNAFCYNFDFSGKNATYFKISNGSKASYIYKIEITYSAAPAKELKSIAISGNPNKITYEAGEAFDPAGLVVTGTYDDDTNEIITSDITWNVTPAGGLIVGTTSVSLVAKVGDVESTAYTVNGLTVTAALPKITITDAQVTDFTASYKEYDWTVNNVSGKMFAFKTNGMQFNTSKDGYYVYNTDPIPGKIRSIKMTTHNSGTEREWDVWVSEEPITDEEGVEVQLDKKKVTKEGTTWDVSGNYQYFYLQDNNGASNISEIVITYVPCINMPISEVGWATAYVPFNATVSENATAYYVTGTNGETLEKTPVTVIKAGEGVLLKSNDGGVATVTFTASAETADKIEGNLMEGTLTETTFEAPGYKYYILANGENGLGFYYQGKDNTTGASATCAAGKAVLAVPTGSSAKSFFSLFDEADGIEAIHNSQCRMQNTQYNLNGMRVNGNYKGIVIINGKKVVK